ncbi:substrate-binding domain-containing protein [Streptomyces sp. NPDC046821]|uniref:substrate-binding domain-containing protein n=1 Tax=Streptomyces sp. NPDC046821 TaxID=3154702 RepID=UPI003408041B
MTVGTGIKYMRLAEELRRGLRDGAWPPGTKLPTEAELAATHDLSVNTVRRALEVLAPEGSVERRQGAGTFARQAPRPPGVRRRIAVVLPERDWYFPPVIAGIETVAARTRTSIEVHTIGYGDVGWGRLERLVSGLADVDGVLVTHPGPSETAPPDHARLLHGLSVPYVLLERAPFGIGDPSEHVSTDHAGGAYLALAHLAALGHRDVALACRTGSAPSRGIREGFTQGAAALGLRVVDRFDWPLLSRWGTLEGALAAQAPFAEEVLREVRGGGATAMVCFGDVEGLALLAAADRAGVRVPGDLALVSCEDRHASTAPVPLTSVAPEKFRLGGLALETLLRRLDEPEGELRQVWLRPRLTVRESCGAAAFGARSFRPGAYGTGAYEPGAFGPGVANPS